MLWYIYATCRKQCCTLLVCVPLCLLWHWDNVIQSRVYLLTNVYALSHNLPGSLIAHVHIFFDKSHRQFGDKDKLRVANDARLVGDLIAGSQTMDFTGEMPG